MTTMARARAFLFIDQFAAADLVAIHNLHLNPWAPLVAMLVAIACSLDLAQLDPAHKLVTRAWQTNLEQATVVAVSVGAATWDPDCSPHASWSALSSL